MRSTRIARARAYADILQPDLKPLPPLPSSPAARLAISLAARPFPPPPSAFYSVAFASFSLSGDIAMISVGFLGGTTLHTLTLAPSRCRSAFLLSPIKTLTETLATNPHHHHPMLPLPSILRAFSAPALHTGPLATQEGQGRSFFTFFSAPLYLYLSIHVSIFFKCFHLLPFWWLQLLQSPNGEQRLISSGSETTRMWFLPISRAGTPVRIWSSYSSSMRST